MPEVCADGLFCPKNRVNIEECEGPRVTRVMSREGAQEILRITQCGVDEEPDLTQYDDREFEKIEESMTDFYAREIPGWKGSGRKVLSFADHTKRKGE